MKSTLVFTTKHNSYETIPLFTKNYVCFS